MTTSNSRNAELIVGLVEAGDRLAVAAQNFMLAVPAPYPRPTGTELFDAVAAWQEAKS